MRCWLHSLLVWLLLGALTWAQAGGTLSVRLIEASNEGSSSGALTDLDSILRGNLPFKQFRLVDAQSVSLPANGAIQLSGGFAVQCNGDAPALAVSISRSGSVVLNTTVSLFPGNPVILGGFPNGAGRLLIVLLAQ